LLGFVNLAKMANSENKFTSFRKQIHQNPELSGEENETKQFVKDVFSALNCELTELTEKGLAFTFRSHKKGNHVMFRAELDALPITEENDFKHASKNKGVAHLCGHDGHMSILFSLGFRLNQTPPQKGAVTLLFQPAEETGEGANAILNADAFSNIKPDFIIALHNIPGEPKNRILARPGVTTPAVTSLIVTLKGKTSHAASPQKGINPAWAVARIIDLAKNFEAAFGSPEKIIITPIHINVGEKAYGTAAGEGSVHFTLRANDQKVLDKACHFMERKASEICENEQLKVDFKYTETFKANVNNDFVFKQIKASAEYLKLDFVTLQNPFPWGEDFGLFTQHFKGAMFGLGAGENRAELHNPDYDFPDEIRETGVDMFYELAKRLA
jgi:amidohydrolase